MTPLRYGMVGGGRDAFIGAVHRKAVRARRPGRARGGRALVDAGQGAAPRARDLGLARRPHLRQLAGAARRRARAARRTTASTSSPSSRPTTCTTRSPRRSSRRASTWSATSRWCTRASRPTSSCGRRASAGIVFGVTYNYTGYPMVRAGARHGARAASSATIRKVVVEYSQGWLATLLEPTGNKQARLAHRPRALRRRRRDGRHRLARREPARDDHRPPRRHTCAPTSRRSSRAGSSTTTRACCCASTEARAACSSASQIAIGYENELEIARARHRRAACSWRQEEPNELLVRRADEPLRVLRRGNAVPRCRRDEGDADPARSPGGVHRGLRERLPRRVRGDPGAGGRPCARGPRGRLPERRRRRAGRAVHRARRRVELELREVARGLNRGAGSVSSPSRPAQRRA